MNEVKWAIITGADGGMGTEITRAVATAGYHVIMACYNPQKAENVCQRLMKETGNPNLEVLAIDLSSMHSVASFTDRILERKLSISLLMNNAGTMETGFSITNDGFERTVSVNYVGPYLLTRKLLSNYPNNFGRKESLSMLPIRELSLLISSRCISGSTL